jgi:PTH1 family peptidyl-tRNA hydrolase
LFVLTNNKQLTNKQLSERMKLIVGLGNPGIEYQFTPHNAGFLAIDRIAEICGVSVANRRGRALTARARLAGQEVLLAKPETFMNLSGLSVAALLKDLELTPDTKGGPVKDLIVLYDELAIPLGQLRIRERGSAGGHNGIKSILSSLGTEEFIRVRIGVGKPPTVTGREIKAGGTNYLLAPVRRMQLQELDEVLDQAVRAVEMVLTEGTLKAMNEFNRKVNGTPEDPAAQ